MIPIGLLKDTNYIQNFEFKFEHDKFALVAMYALQKNACIRMFIPFESIYASKQQLLFGSPAFLKLYQTGSIELKGNFNWNSFSNGKKDNIKKFFC